MFTGIVAELGRVEECRPGADSVRLTVSGRLLAGVTDGESVAVNGVCLTAVDPAGERMGADVMAETLHRSALADLRPGDRVNLERPVTPTTLLGGHVVQGHVDGVGTIVDRRPGDGWEWVRIATPAGLDRYVVEKGSVAVDGVSLTVTTVDADGFEVSLIPETLRRTTLGLRGVGDRVNLEVDVLAKYVEKLLDARAGTGAGARRGEPA